MGGFALIAESQHSNYEEYFFIKPEKHPNCQKNEVFFCSFF